jgi:hypothetical protein
MDANIGLSTTALAQGQTGIDTVVVENSRGSDVFMYWSGVTLNLADVTLNNSKIKNRFTNSLVREKYSLDVKVINQSGDAIVNANVSVYDKNNNLVFSTLTYPNGTINTREITYATYEKAQGQVLYSPHNITITMPAYDSYTAIWNHSKKEDWIIALLPEVP